MSAIEARDLIDDVFEEEALVVGGLVALHRLEDEVVWQLVRSLDAIHAKACRRLEKSGLSRPDDRNDDSGPIKPHPAVEEFLLKLRGACR